METRSGNTESGSGRANEHMNSHDTDTEKKEKKTFVIFLFFFFLWHVPVGDDPSKRVDWVGAGSVRGTNQSTTTSKYILSVWSDHSAQIYNEIKEKLARRVSVRDFFFVLRVVSLCIACQPQRS